MQLVPQWTDLRGQVLLGWVVRLLMPWELSLGCWHIGQACGSSVSSHAIICPQQIRFWLLDWQVPFA